MTETMAKMTTLMCDSLAPVLFPNLVVIHSAPVMTLERRSQTARKIIRKIWLKTGQTQGRNTPLTP